MPVSLRMTPRVAIRKLSLLGVIIGFAVSVPAAQLEEARSELKFTDQTLARFRSQHALQFLRRYSQPEPARLSDASACPERSRWSKDQFIGGDRCDHRHHRDGG